MTTKLTVEDGCLMAGEHILLVLYAAGDCDTIEWPLTERGRRLLDRALYDSREMGLIENADRVTLPDGEEYVIDESKVDLPSDNFWQTA